ncbi:MAG: NAD-binding protein, partial [Pseudoxanthomonas sp.]|nr:NAD-binding protein [Pseudoxanthomonas sp.]
PFRGLLLGLFFLAVGMALDLAVVAANWLLILAAVPAMMLVKALCIYVVARLFRSRHGEALDRAVVMAQGGEFAFVLYASAAAGGLLDGAANAQLTAIVVLSMALTPLVVLALRPLLRKAPPSTAGVDAADGLTGSVLLVGFGRFGQVVSQALLARGVDVTLIDTDIEMIQTAERFGFKVYYGDGTRLDVLNASGAASARVILVCVDDREAALRIATLARAAFPQARLLVRAWDREHALRLLAAGVDGLVRETFESALQFGEDALRLLGVDAAEAARVRALVRQRDAERFQMEIASGAFAPSSDLLYTNQPQRMRQAPLVEPRTEGRRLDIDAETGSEAETTG